MSKNKLLTYRGAVTTQECDSNGHMNVMFYINKYELAGRNLFAQIGLTKPFLQENNYGIAVLEQQIHYLQEVFEDDILYMESQVSEVTRKVITAFHELKDGLTHKTVGTASIKAVIFDKNERKAILLPEKLKKKIRLLDANTKMLTE